MSVLVDNTSDNGVQVAMYKIGKIKTMIFGFETILVLRIIRQMKLWPQFCEHQNPFLFVLFVVMKPSNTNNNTFPEHVPAAEAAEGVKSGVYKCGILNVNPNNHNQAFLKFGPGTRDMFIDGYRYRNRALHGDTVIAAVIPQAGAAPGAQTKGEVICMVKRPSSEFVGRVAGFREDQTIKKTDANVMFVPDDAKMQRMLVCRLSR